MSHAGYHSSLYTLSTSKNSGRVKKVISLEFYFQRYNIMCQMKFWISVFYGRLKGTERAMTR